LLSKKWKDFPLALFALSGLQLSSRPHPHAAPSAGIFLFLTFFNNILNLTRLASYFRTIARLVVPSTAVVTPPPLPQRQLAPAHRGAALHEPELEPHPSWIRWYS